MLLSWCVGLLNDATLETMFSIAAPLCLSSIIISSKRLRALPVFFIKLCSEDRTVFGAGWHPGE